jgi:hypothetical protein
LVQVKLKQNESQIKQKIGIEKILERIYSINESRSSVDEESKEPIRNRGGNNVLFVSTPLTPRPVQSDSVFVNSASMGSVFINSASLESASIY